MYSPWERWIRENFHFKAEEEEIALRKYKIMSSNWSTINMYFGHYMYYGPLLASHNRGWSRTVTNGEEEISQTLLPKGRPQLRDRPLILLSCRNQMIQISTMAILAEMRRIRHPAYYAADRLLWALSTKMLRAIVVEDAYPRFIPTLPPRWS